MDINGVITAITTVGFPIVMCGAMGWFVKYSNDQHIQQMDAERALHDQEMKDVTAALNNNTVALQKLTDYIERTKVYEK